MIYMIWNIVLLICVPVEFGMSFFWVRIDSKIPREQKSHITKRNSLLSREEFLGKTDKSKKNGEKRRKRKNRG